MAEERQWDLRRTAFFALPAVDAGVRDVRKPAQVEHRVSRDDTMADHQVWLLELVCTGNTDRAVIDACVTLHAAAGLLCNGLPEDGSQGFEVVLAPFVAKLEHCILNLSADLDTLGVGCLGCKFLGIDSALDEFCTFLGADFNKGGLAGLLANNSPVPAGKVCLPGDLYLAAAAV